MATEITVRRAERRDRDALGRLGALLLRVHHDFDPHRFIPPGDDPEGGYGWFLASQLADREATVLVAVQGGAVVGYAWASIEPHSWKELRAECAYLHDLVVAPDARGGGVGRALVDAVVAWSRG